MERFPRWARWTAGIVAALVLAAVVFVAAFPVGPLKRAAENRLSARFGRPVTIGALERREAFSFTPTIVARDVRVPQAAWAGTGDLARIGEVQVTVPALPILLGRFAPRDIAASGVRLTLVRDRDGRTNWRKADDRDTAGGDAPLLQGLTLSDTIVAYRDAKQNRAFSVRVTADARGLRVAGSGTVRGARVRIRAQGADVTGHEGAWPFVADIDGAALAMRATGRMERPLDTDRMAFRITARANDLKLIDAVIEAGLFGTQPVRLSADVRREAPKWFVTGLNGTIGTSAIAGRLSVDKIDGRTRLDGAVTARTLDFDDFADDAGQAKALALERAQGLRLVPNTRVNIAKIDRTDGRIAFDVARIVSKRRPSSLTGAKGVVTIERQLMTVDPLTIGLTQGAITGAVTVDQRGGRQVPVVTLALDLKRSSLSALAGGGEVDARLDGRVRLTGSGSTIRAAVGRSNGTCGLAARDGGLPAKIAALLGFDVGGGMLADGDARATLRCAVVRLDMARGRGTLVPLVIDTSLSQTLGAGTVRFPDEAIAVTLTGAPKRGATLRLPGSIVASGTLRDPQVAVPKDTKSAGNILKAIGRAITGRQGPRATDADCAALIARALG